MAPGADALAKTAAAAPGIDRSFDGWGKVMMSALSAGVRTALTTSSMVINSFEIKGGRLPFDGGGFTSPLSRAATWVGTAVQGVEHSAGAFLSCRS
jgi:hypothetical protein